MTPISMQPGSLITAPGVISPFSRLASAVTAFIVEAIGYWPEIARLNSGPGPSLSLPSSAS